MSDWRKAKKLIQKAFKSGYFRVCYGQIVGSDNANSFTPYPFTEEETKFLADYFGEKEEAK